MGNPVKYNIEGPLTYKKLEALMDLFSDDLFYFVRGIVANDQSSEEIVSDVFIKLWSKRSEYQNINNIKPFLFILARNESISYLRKNKRMTVLSIEDVNEFDLDPFESDGTDLFDQEKINEINTAIENLPVKCKMAFTLAKVNGLKYKEIAKIMEISPHTVKNHIAYALEKICTFVGVSQKENKISSKTNKIKVTSL
jgi:RNA polymerase sigma-70 factor (ECF subfamily)